MANKLIVAPAPHVQTAQSTTRIMRDVVIALMPALVVSTVVFGLDVLRVTALSVVSCVVIEYLIQKFMVRGATTVGNWSAVVTGVLLAFNLPASIPWWIVVMGAFVAIAVAKMTFGGLGKNPFNPALVGRVFLLIAYPVQMTTWPLPVNGSFDVLSGATPLAAVKRKLLCNIFTDFITFLTDRRSDQYMDIFRLTSHLLQLADRLSPNPCHRSFPAGVGRSNDPFYRITKK